MIKIKISERARTYGYVIWGYRMDADMSKLLGHSDEARIVFLGKDLGKKRINWQYRRISVGPNQTKKISPAQQYFVLSTGRKGELIVETE